MSTRYKITTASGSVHEGYVQGSGGLMRGVDGIRRLRRASKGRPVNIYDPTRPPPYTTGDQEITHVALYLTTEVGRGTPFETVPILGASVELA